MDENAFIATADQRVNELAKTYSMSKDRAFLVWASAMLWDLDEDDAVEAIMDRPNDKSVDFFWYDDSAERIVICQAKYSKSKKGLKLKDLSAFPSCIGWLSKPEDLAHEGLPDLSDAARQYLELRERDVPVDLWFVHFAPRIPNFEKEAEVFNQTAHNSSGRIRLHVISKDELRVAFEDREDATDRVVKDVLPVKWIKPQKGAYGTAFVATVEGRELAELYKKHGNKLFARNVRLYLGERADSVNRGIAATLEDEDDRSNFWAYNNGVTLVCFRAQPDEDGTAVTLENFTIVNGCQTTVSLANADDLDDSTEVLVKIINPSSQVVDRIIEFTNSQNQIRAWDIKSQDRVQRRLREELQALDKPYFYVIRKGEFEALTIAERRSYRSNGQRRTIKFDSLAQYLAAFDSHAYHAYKFKARLFENLYRDVFPTDIDEKYVLFVWQVGEAVRAFVREEIAKAAKDQDENRVRILKKGCRIYLLTVVALLMRKRNGSTYLAKIADGTTFGAKRAAKVAKYLTWALDFYIEAVERMTEDGSADLNTLVRQEDFITKVQVIVNREFDRIARARDYFNEALPLLRPAAKK